MSLEERYVNDPELLVFHKKKLLEPGWAGELDRVYIIHFKSQGF